MVKMRYYIDEIGFFKGGMSIIGWAEDHAAFRVRQSSFTMEFLSAPFATLSTVPILLLMGEMQREGGVSRWLR